LRTNPFPPLNHFISSDAEDSDEVVVVEQKKEAMPSNRRSSQLPVSANQFKGSAQRSRKKRKAPPSELEENSSGSAQKAARIECSEKGCTVNALDSGKCWKHKGYKYCSQDRCTSRALKGGVCIRHEEFAIKKAARVKCSVEGCNGKAADSGTCRKKHKGYNHCSQEDCTNQVVKGGICRRHGAKQTCSLNGCRTEEYVSSMVPK